MAYGMYGVWNVCRLSSVESRKVESRKPGYFIFSILLRARRQLLYTTRSYQIKQAKPLCSDVICDLRENGDTGFQPDSISDRMHFAQCQCVGHFKHTVNMS
jgi:hypothetical protein